MPHIINVLCEAAMKAMALHKQDKPEFADIDNEQATDNLKAILQKELSTFINNDLKEASASWLSEEWVKQLINAQCNLWAVKALRAAKEESHA